MKELSIIAIMPAHNEELLLRSRVQELIVHSQTRPIHAMILAENGSSDGTRQICDELCKKKDKIQISSLHLPIGDYGLALAEGIRWGLERFNHEKTWFLLTAADLPFGISDIDNFLQLNGDDRIVVIGSKGHAKSRLERTWKRRLLSLVFHILRQVFLGLPYTDTQGTIFLPLSGAREILPQVKSRGFFFTTELIFRLHRMKYKIIEVPITLRVEERESKVRWFRDSLRMFKSTLLLSTERFF
jgi:dolichol-phosphate mannosyltransferase